MLHLLFDRLLAHWPGWGDLHAFDKITSRAALAAVVSFVLAIAFGSRVIAWLRARFREPIKSPSAAIAQLHQTKESTPTMGGIFIVGGLLGSALVFGDWHNPFLPVAVLLALSLAALGAWDDWIKLTTSARGLTARRKLLIQTVIALVAAWLVYRAHVQTERALEWTLPFAAGRISLGWLFVPLATLVIVGASNAVNLTDGLDGLAGGCLICATAAMALVVYASGHAPWARYLGIQHIVGAGEMVVVAAGMIGGLLGFLWFNCHPASVFMGDTGSLPLGGLLGLLAVIARQELLLVVIGGVFVIEAASVMLQIGWFRCTKRRIFLCAPLHHHFQLRGWPEDKIVVRFWIAAALCALVGLAGIKLAPAESPDSPQLTQSQQPLR